MAWRQRDSNDNRRRNGDATAMTATVMEGARVMKGTMMMDGAMARVAMDNRTMTPIEATTATPW